MFETLIPKPMMQHYISLLLKHRRLVLSGPSGTGKSYLASRLAEYLVDRSVREVTNGIAVTFNMQRQSCKVMEKGCPWWIITFFHLASFWWLLLSTIVFLVLRICNFIYLTWLIRLIENPAHRRVHLLSFWMTFMTHPPLVSLSMGLLLANITNGTLPEKMLDVFFLALLKVWFKFSKPLIVFAIFVYSPYIIGTSNQPIKMIANHGLHLSFRFVTEVFAFSIPVLFLNVPLYHDTLYHYIHLDFTLYFQSTLLFQILNCNIFSSSGWWLSPTMWNQQMASWCATCTGSWWSRSMKAAWTMMTWSGC